MAEARVTPKAKMVSVPSKKLQGSPGWFIETPPFLAFR